MKIILTERQYNLLIEQSMGGMSSGQSFAQHSTEGAKYAVEKLSKYSLSQFMEDLRGFLSSGSGVIIQIIIDAIPGIGQILNVGAWSLLTLYDVMLGTTKNKWNWYNIIVDIVGVITTGPGGKWVKNALSKVSKFATGTIESFGASVKKYAPKAFEYISKIIKSISSVTSTISSQLKKLISYLGKYFKNTSIYKGLVNLESYISSKLVGILEKIEASFGSNVAQKTSNVIKTGKHVGTHYTQHNVLHAGTSLIPGAAHS